MSADQPALEGGRVEGGMAAELFLRTASCLTRLIGATGLSAAGKREESTRRGGRPGAKRSESDSSPRDLDAENEPLVSPLETPSDSPDAPADSDPPDPDPQYKAVGVEYEQGGVVKRAYLKASILRLEGSGFAVLGVRSVILAAGALMTPKILMNSGIGPVAALERAGVKVLVGNEEVGRNLQDHPAVGVTYSQRASIGERSE